MNEKILEALKSLLPEDKVETISAAINEALEEAKKEIEAEYNTKLEEAYAQVGNELEEAEKTAETGYQEAYTIISDLRNRLEMQKTEFEKALEEGYEEAYQMLQQEKSKNENLEVDMYAEYDKKLNEMKEYIVDKVHEFLQVKGKEIYGQARRDIVNDPRMAEHRVALGKIVDVVSDYITNDEAVAISNSKLEETRKAIEDLQSQKRILEARNVRLSTENTKLNDNVRVLSEQVNKSKQETLNESKKEKIEKAKNVQGRGEKVVQDTVITETDDDKNKKTITEETDPDVMDMQILAGLRKSD